PRRVDQRGRAFPRRRAVHRPARGAPDAGLPLVRLHRRAGVGRGVFRGGVAMSIPVVALIGRPNVGKSALFNRLAGGDAAIVTEQAGTTRDRNFARADWNGRTFWLVYTGGLTDDPNVPMDVEIRRQVMQAIAE